MALDTFLTGTKAKDEIIRQAIEDILPLEETFFTLSGKAPFSEEYKPLFQTPERSDMSHSLVELSFQYIAKVITACYCQGDVNPIEYSPADKSIDNLKWKLSTEYYSELKERYDYAVMRILDYIDNENDSLHNLVQHCWYLAKLDVCYKKGAVPSDVGQFFVPATDTEVSEIRNLSIIFKKKFLPEVLTPESTVIFNPEFGFAQELMGESDCHMIIDRSIIDLRADLSPDYPTYRIAKSIGCYMMTLLNQEFNDRNHSYEINNLVFFSGRFGETEILGTEDISEEDVIITLDKIVLATEAKYKAKKPYEEEEEPVKPVEKGSEGFLDEYEREVKDYNDGYNQVIHRKKHHIFRNLMIFIIIVSLLVVAFCYAKDWYTGNFGNDFEIEHIIHNIFG